MHDLKRTITEALGQTVTQMHSRSGGCINEAYLATLADGSKMFAKTHANAARYPRMFASEAAGLRAMAAAKSSLVIPQPIACDDHYLMMETISEGPQPCDFEEQLGRGLAELHRHTTHTRFGFECDNYLGSTPQANGWMDDWVIFWAERRLKPMLHDVRGDAELDRLGVQLLDRLDVVLAGDDEPACLLHGDLWPGNAMATADGKVAIFDPACYFGKREAEFGMTRLFGFGSHFEAAYNENYPPLPGADRRIAVYTLHHLLNHLRLFGSGYLNQCVSQLRKVI